jgi:hypothetical protein
MRFDRMSALLELVRWQGRGLRHDYSAGRGLLDICYTAAEVGVPVEFISSGLCVLEAAANRIGASMASVVADFSEVVAYQRAAEDANRDELERAGQEVAARGCVPRDTVLLGDPAVLIGLYGTLRAYHAKTWVVGLPQGAGAGERSIIEEAVTAVPSEMRFGSQGTSQGLLRRASRNVTVDGETWLIPGLELLTVQLAGRVGEPEANPESPSWAQLAAVLKGNKDDVAIDGVLQLAHEVGLRSRVDRGLAIVSIVFPELVRLIPPQNLEIPAWEKIALRVAANRLVHAAVGEEG